MNKNIIQKEINKIKKKGKTVGLCHGVFDLIHYGHIHYQIMLLIQL
jgi:bifunctional ADP-heptose synthase (sugar kinase/adenylyltransferase)